MPPPGKPAPGLTARFLSDYVTGGGRLETTMNRADASECAPIHKNSRIGAHWIGKTLKKLSACNDLHFFAAGMSS
jgi:hypothetical protein